MPGAFTSGTNHFTNAGKPGDPHRESAYNALYGELRDQIGDRLAALIPPEADVWSVADEVVRIVGLPQGDRPFRTHVDPSRDGSEVVSVVADRIRHDFFHRIGIPDLLPRNAAL
ncbi:hypothetical protein [Amycolatopsis pigmentata]|uniref:Uncharacterized protein n=1 Tax=Amycolatopsis pigmentata TaxID=450801 RepID=A0ABW5FZH2_9PSEU